MRETAVPPKDQVSSVARALRVLEVVGESPTGLATKQIARRCDMNVAATNRMLRTLAHKGYVMRRDDGGYMLGLALADRFRELAAAMRGPSEVGEVLRRAAVETGYSHYMASFVDKRVAITATAEGARSPYMEDLVPGFDDGAHATALGKALLATLAPHQRAQYLREQGMRPFTQATLRSPAALDADIARGMRHGMQVEIGQYKAGVACAGLTVIGTGELHRRYVVACCMPAAELVQQEREALRGHLARTAHDLARVIAPPMLQAAA